MDDSHRKYSSDKNTKVNKEDDRANVFEERMSQALGALKPILNRREYRQASKLLDSVEDFTQDVDIKDTKTNTLYLFEKHLNNPSDPRTLALSFLNANTSNGAQAATQGATFSPIASSEITNLSYEVITKGPSILSNAFAPLGTPISISFEKSIELSFDISGSAYNSFLTNLTLSALPNIVESVNTGVNQSGDYNVQIGVAFDSALGSALGGVQELGVFLMLKPA